MEKEQTTQHIKVSPHEVIGEMWNTTVYHTSSFFYGLISPYIPGTAIKKLSEKESQSKNNFLEHIKMIGGTLTGAVLGLYVYDKTPGNMREEVIGAYTSIVTLNLLYEWYKTTEKKLLERKISGLEKKLEK